MKKYVYSNALLAEHHVFKTAKLVRICAEIESDGVTMHAESGHNLAIIKPLGKIKLTEGEWNDRPGDDIDYTKWAFAQFGFKIA